MDDERRLIDAAELELAIAEMPDFGWVTVSGEGRALLCRLDVLKVIAAQPTVSLAPPPTNACAEPAWPRPIPVTERLPKNPDPVLVYSIDPDIPGWYTGFYVALDDFPTERRWVMLDRELIAHPSPLENVTHWLPLPPPPTE